VLRAVRHLKPIDPLIGALDDFAWNAAELRTASPLDKDFINRFNQSADDLIQKIRWFTVADKSQRDAIAAIREFKIQSSVGRWKSAR
jgi:hypothetical protein